MDKDKQTIKIKQCSSATCQGNENGCGSGDCITSKHHAKHIKWTDISLEAYIDIFGHPPAGQD